VSVQVKIIKFPLGYDSTIEAAEAKIAHGLEEGWTIAAGGGTQNVGFVVMVRSADATSAARPDGLQEWTGPSPTSLEAEKIMEVEPVRRRVVLSGVDHSGLHQ